MPLTSRASCQRATSSSPIPSRSSRCAEPRRARLQLLVTFGMCHVHAPPCLWRLLEQPVQTRLIVQNNGGKHFFTSFLSRERCLELIISRWQTELARAEDNVPMAEQQAEAEAGPSGPGDNVRPCAIHTLSRECSISWILPSTSSQQRTQLGAAETRMLCVVFKAMLPSSSISIAQPQSR